MKFPGPVEYWHVSDLDPTDRQSFRQFGICPLRTEFIYRFYNSEMRLLYVGITWNPYMRWSDHARKKSWWNEVSHAEVWLCRDDRHARAVETWCIKNLDPLYNIHQNERKPRATDKNN